MAIDLLRARRETPGCTAVLHLNNAGAALMPQPVLHAVLGHVQREALLGGYEAAEQAHDAVERVYDAAATLLGCQRDAIAFMENATRAWDEADEIRQMLAGQHSNVTVSRLTSTRLDMQAHGLTSVVRASVHYYNSEAEVDRFCATLATMHVEGA